jgi:hypothetical protein
MIAERLGAALRRRSRRRCDTAAVPNAGSTPIRAPARSSLCLVLTLAASAPAGAFPFGAGTCEAAADGSFMPSRTHHPGDDGGFAIGFDRAGYYAGETLVVRIAHPAAEAFSGFLLYAQDGDALREGVFDPVPGSTLGGGLPAECSFAGHTVTHEDGTLRDVIALRWTAAAAPAATLQFRGLVLRADPFAQQGTDFYELVAVRVLDPDGVFRDRFEPQP